MVQEDGTLRLPDRVVKQTPSGAVIALAGGRHDGWTVWRLPSHGDRSLAELRAEFEESEVGRARAVGQLALDEDALTGGRVQFTGRRPHVRPRRQRRPTTLARPKP